jgi:hypothetical protein
MDCDYAELLYLRSTLNDRVETPIVPKLLVPHIRHSRVYGITQLFYVESWTQDVI